MLAKLLGCLGLNSTEDVIEFFICGLAVLPAMLFLSGERNAAAVVILLLINGLLIYGMRAREMENLREAEELARKQNPAEDSKPPAES